MATKKAEPRVKLELTGATAGKGAVTGKGTLTTSLWDAAKAGVTVEKREKDTVVTLSTTGGITFRKNRGLVFSGDLEKLMKGKFAGKVGVTFKFSKDVDFLVSHKFKPGEDTTTVTITIRI